MKRNFIGCVGLFLLAAGCNEHVDKKVKDAPRVTVSLPLKRQITDFDYYTGHISAKETLDIRARVNGYLDKVFFKDGDDEVPAGAKLFEIDRRPFQADVDRLTGELNRAKASNQTAKSEMERQKLLLERNATSRSDYDVAVGKLGEAVANVETAIGALEQAKINLGYTIVTSRIAGRISKTNITPGNLVVADKTLLTTVVTVDPMYADFRKGKSHGSCQGSCGKLLVVGLLGNCHSHRHGYTGIQHVADFFPIQVVGYLVQDDIVLVVFIDLA